MLTKHVITPENSFSKNIFNIEYGEYYLLENLKTYFSLNYKTPRSYIKENAIEGCLFAVYKDKYIIHTENYSKAKIFVPTNWVRDNLLNLLPDKLDIPDLPPELKKLVLYGERSSKGIFIHVGLTGELFGIKNLHNIFINGAPGFARNEHYKVFIKVINGKNYQVPVFTYSGFVKFVLEQKNDKYKNISECFEQILFIHQLGTTEEKIDLFSKSLGTDAIILKNSLAITGPISCIYLLILNLGAPFIVKYGETTDLTRRLDQHMSDFKTKIYVKYFYYIDAANITRAESELFTYFKKFKRIEEYGDKKRKEIYEVTDLFAIKEIFETIAKKYGNKVSALNENIKNQQNLHELEMQKITNKMLNQKLIYEKQIIELNNQLIFDKFKYETEIEKLNTQIKFKEVEQEKNLLRAELIQFRKNYN